MGYMSLHAIIVSGWPEERVAEAHAKALELLAAADNGDPTAHFTKLLSPILPAVTNGYSSFLIGPDGSKEGWETSDLMDRVRRVFIAWLRPNTWLDWVEVQFGDDDRHTYVIAHSDEDEPRA